MLRAVGARVRPRLRVDGGLFGGAAIDAHGDPLPAATLDACLKADAVLLGAIGGPKWSAPDAKVRPEQGLLQSAQGAGRVRQPAAGDAAALRWSNASTLKAEVLAGRGPRVRARAHRRNLFR